MKDIVPFFLIFVSLSCQAVTPLKTNFPGCTPAKTILFAYTKDHTKAVEFCVMPKAYRYTYGPINHPEITLSAIPGNSGLVRSVSQSGVISTGFAIRNGTYVYLTQRGPKGGDARLLANQYVNGVTQDLAYISLEENGWGFIDNTAEPDAWPDFIE